MKKVKESNKKYIKYLQSKRDCEKIVWSLNFLYAKHSFKSGTFQHNYARILNA